MEKIRRIAKSARWNTFPLKFDNVNKFIEENENLKLYDVEPVWKKILVWMFLKPSVGDQKVIASEGIKCSLI